MTVENFQDEFRQMESLLFGFAMKLTRDRNSAQDLMQDTFMRSFSNLSTFRDGTNLKAWLMTIMRNSFINEYRKKSTRSRHEQYSEELSIGVLEKINSFADADCAIIAHDLQAIVDNLSPIYRIPFTMFYNGYSYIEISEYLKLPIGTTKSRIFQARNLLKTIIKNRYADAVTES